MDGGDSGRPGDSESIAIHIRFSNGSSFTVETALESTVGDLKALLAQRSEVPVVQQRLIYKGRILQDEKTLSSYGVESQHTIHLVHGFVSSTSTSETFDTSPGISRPPENILEQSRSHPLSNDSGAFLSSAVFPGLGANGASSFLSDGIPDLDFVQEQLSQNPNMLREAMDMPIVQNLLNNPEIMRNLIMSNPQMREVIDRNPELAHVLNDPSTLRQTLEAARNPELMREMMRNTDRAMSNIESSPEGFNMLRRMYETIQEPFLNATAASTETGNNPSNPFTALLRNNLTNESSNRPSNLSSTNSEAATGISSSPNINPLPNPWDRSGNAETTTARLSPSEIRNPSIDGLGERRLPDLGRVNSGMLDLSLVNQLMQNPEMSQFMQSLLSNPQFVNQLLRSNPQIRSLMESNPQLRDVFENTDLLRELTSSAMFQQLMSPHQSVLSQFGGLQPSEEQNQPGAVPGSPNFARLGSLMSLFSGLGGGGTALGVPNNPNVPPEELYSTQLAQLQEMGFFDTQENIHALVATSGNVHAAVERLLRNLGQ